MKRAIKLEFKVLSARDGTKDKQLDFYTLSYLVAKTNPASLIYRLSYKTQSLKNNAEKMQVIHKKSVTV